MNGSSKSQKSTFLRSATVTDTDEQILFFKATDENYLVRKMCIGDELLCVMCLIVDLIFKLLMALKYTAATGY